MDIITTENISTWENNNIFWHFVGNRLKRLRHLDGNGEIGKVYIVRTRKCEKLNSYLIYNDIFLDTLKK